MDSNYKMILHWLDSTKKFVKNHPDVLFTKSAKGNITIAINRSEYYRKMEEMLSDTNTYLRISRDPTKKLTTDLRSLLSNWKKKNWIELDTYKRLLTINGVLELMDFQRSIK